MYSGIADKNQAGAPCPKAYGKQGYVLLSDFGIRALAKDEKVYNLEPTINPSNWLGGLTACGYLLFVFRGLLNYGYREEGSGRALPTKHCCFWVRITGKAGFAAMNIIIRKQVNRL